MGRNSLQITNTLFRMIEYLDDEIKLELISKITDSLKRREKISHDGYWKELFGGWQIEESAEDIIQLISESRYTNRQIEEL